MKKLSRLIFPLILALLCAAAVFFAIGLRPRRK